MTDDLTKKSFKMIPPQRENPFERFYKKPEPEPEEPIIQEESVVEELAEELNVSLPKVNLPLGFKLVAVFTLIGGLSLLGSMFADIFNQNDFEFSSYILRGIAGILFVVISYGIVKRQNWTTWLYGAMVILSLFINWPFAILPAAVVVYMYFNRKFLYSSIFDRLFNKLSSNVGNKLR